MARKKNNKEEEDNAKQVIRSFIHLARRATPELRKSLYVAFIHKNIYIYIYIYIQFLTLMTNFG
jgi:hypothetical protein